MPTRKDDRRKGWMKFSVILPVYKSRRYLLRNLPIIYRYMESLRVPFEIMIAEDGSGDVFDPKIRRFMRMHRNVRYVHSERKLGRGKALKNCVKTLKGDVIGYMDIDLATDISAMKDVVDVFRTGQYDVVAGSRYALSKAGRGSTGRTLKRLVASKAFNFIVRLLLGSKLEDHQCGFKFFRAGFIKRYASMAKDDLWFWDTEILVLAQRDGKRVYELPVKYKEAGRSTVKMFNDTLDMFKNVLSLYWRLRSEN